jgi:hypothetical protein
LSSAYPLVCLLTYALGDPKLVSEAQMPKKRTTIPVSERALIQRINRVLAKEDQVLKATRGMQASLDLGRYFILDCRANFVLDKHLDLKALGRKLGCLRAWERVGG